MFVLEGPGSPLIPQSQQSIGGSTIFTQATSAYLPNNRVMHPLSMRLGSAVSPNPMGMYTLRQLHLSRAKLKASSRTSALLSGFAMVAMVEIQLTPKCIGDEDPKAHNCSHVPESLLIAFSVCTTLLVAVHLLALMISTCVLPHVEAVANMAHVDSLTNVSSPSISESPHVTMHRYIEAAWTFSTVLGILLFLVEIGLLSWVKFLDYSRPAAIGSTILLVPIVILFTLFALHFYYKLVAHKVEHADKNLKDLEQQLKALQEGNTNGQARSDIHLV
ncbi:unnamed protein product [Meganyctiphanes norvegica]|uniref:Calcium release-activated calcium channel protein 1 n=1 Tax=Meganyctiphanes norvegica TaxID=48144 RepID=A0AAV2SJY0_MEGNR